MFKNKKLEKLEKEIDKLQNKVFGLAQLFHEIDKNSVSRDAMKTHVGRQMRELERKLCSHDNAKFISDYNPSKGTVYMGSCNDCGGVWNTTKEKFVESKKKALEDGIASLQTQLEELNHDQT